MLSVVLEKSLIKRPSNFYLFIYLPNDSEDIINKSKAKIH